MAQTKVFLDYGLPTLNNIITEAKKSPFAYAALKKKTTGIIEADLVSGGCVPDRMYDFVAVSFLYSETAKKRDPDNVAAGAAKFVLDAMVNTQIIPDDTRDQILEINHNFTGGIHAKRGVYVSWYGGWHEPE